MKKTFFLRDDIYTKEKVSLAKREKEFTNSLTSFFDLNTEALFQPTMSKRVIFNTSFENKLFEITGVQPEEVKLALEKSKLNNDKWFQRNRPVYFILILAVKYFTEKKMQKEKQLALVLLAVIIYSGRHQKYFMYNDSNAFEAAMQYTINNLTDKFLIKQKGNVYSALESIANGNDKTYIKSLEEADDKGLIDWVTSLYTRVNQFVKLFANQFYSNYNSKKYINIRSDYDDESGEVLNNDNQSVIIQKITDSTYLKTRVNAPDVKIARLSAASNKISQVTFKNAVISVYKNETESIRKLISLILMIFLVDEKKRAENIHSADFMLVSLNAFSKSNTQEPNVINMKKTLDELLERNSAEFNKTERLATKNSYRRGLFQYFVMLIQSN